MNIPPEFFKTFFLKKNNVLLWDIIFKVDLIPLKNLLSKNFSAYIEWAQVG